MQTINNPNVAHELQFNVSQLLKEVTGANRDYEICVEQIKRFDDIQLVEPLTGYVRFLRTGPDVLVEGTLQTTIQRECGRCLMPFKAVITIELEELFYPTVDLVSGKLLSVPEDVDEATRIDERHTLDLYEVVRQAIGLESESHRYCRVDCKGLCPHCGQDRNTNPCTCEDESIDVRWAGLLAKNIED
jgi:uncharacterized protein